MICLNKYSGGKNIFTIRKTAVQWADNVLFNNYAKSGRNHLETFGTTRNINCTGLEHNSIIRPGQVTDL